MPKATLESRGTLPWPSAGALFSRVRQLGKALGARATVGPDAKPRALPTSTAGGKSRTLARASLRKTFSKNIKEK